jgi:signal peptidase I
MAVLASCNPIRSLARVARAGVGLFSTVLTVAVVVALLLPPLFGYQRYVIYGGSMEPEISKGSVVYDKEVPVASLRKGDVITYVPPTSKRPVTHRISAIEKGPLGAPVFQTKGDANAHADFRKFALTRPTQAAYAFHLPLLGWLLIAMSVEWVRGVLIGGPALLAAAVIVRNLWRQGGELVEAQAREEAASS